MRCPKCQYLSFDRADRCRNCGYDFSLASDVETLDLPIRTGDEPVGPLADFDLTGANLPSPDPTPAEAPRERAGRTRASSRPTPSPELPLFGAAADESDAPLVSLPASPRPPVAVRKSTPTIRPSTQTLDDAAPEPSRVRRARAASVPPTPREEAGAGETDAAAPAARVLGGAVDLALLGGIDAGIVSVTLRLCGLTWGEAGALPWLPVVAYLAILNGGYLAIFTAAGGQTIGKMLAGTRVVNADEAAWTERVPLGQAVLRSAAYLASLLPAGLGFLPAVLGGDRRAIHDRIAHTRVVRA